MRSVDFNGKNMYGRLPSDFNRTNNFTRANDFNRTNN